MVNRVIVGQTLSRVVALREEEHRQDLCAQALLDTFRARQLRLAVPLRIRLLLQRILEKLRKVLRARLLHRVQQAAERVPRQPRERLVRIPRFPLPTQLVQLKLVLLQPVLRWVVLARVLVLREAF